MEKKLAEQVDDLRKEAIISALRKSKTSTEAIERLGTPRATFYRYLQRYKIDLEDFRDSMRKK